MKALKYVRPALSVTFVLTLIFGGLTVMFGWHLALLILILSFAVLGISAAIVGTVIGAYIIAYWIWTGERP